MSEEEMGMNLTPIMETALFVLKHPTKIKTFKWKKSFEFSLNVVDIAGLFLEFGVWKGASINRIASLIPDKTVYGFDSFNGLTEDWCGHEKGYLKVENVQEVLNNVRSNVQIIVGLFQETLEPFLKEHKEKVAFVHLDADLYSSTKYVLDTLAKHNRLQKGTVIQFDEFLTIKFPSTERFAFRDFVKEFNIKYDVIAVNKGRVVVKIKELN